MNYELHAIVLHKSYWKESSLLVQLMTNSLGVVSSIVQGARKEKSPFFSLFDIGNSLEIILSKSPSANLYKATSATIIPRKNSHTLSYPQLLATQAILEVYTQLHFTSDETERFYLLLQTYLDYIPTVENNIMLVIWRFLIRLTDELGFPLVYFENNTYQISDIELFDNEYDEGTKEIIKSWLAILPTTTKIIKEPNILNPSCHTINRFIFDWFNIHLNKKIHHKAIELYEQWIIDRDC